MKTAIPREYEGKPLLAFLRNELKISGRLLTRLKQTEDGITVNGEHVTVRHTVKCGDVLVLKDWDCKPSEHIIPRELPVSVVFENDELIALNKPPHMPTHPSHGHFDDTLANALAHLFRDTPFVFRPVNRLDRDTSGIVLAAKDQRTAAHLAESMCRGGFEKMYIAILDGELLEGGIIDAHIRRDRESIIIRRVCDPAEDGAQLAVTEYCVLDVKNGHTLVLVKPKTGRTHQIRVHFASLGTPITGDDLYGRPSPLIDRQALHAYSLEFCNTGGEKLCLTAPLPEDMCRLAEAFGLTIPKI